jgi:flavodoxin
MQVRKVFKIIIVIITVLIVIFAVFAAMFVLDISAYTATGSQTLTPDGTSVGKALVLYDPGYSGNSKKVADQVAADLQTKNYTVTLAGIKSADAQNTAGYGIIVVGGPIYASTPTASVKDYLNNLRIDVGTAVGVYGSGQGATTPEDIAQIKNGVATLQSGVLENAVVVKIGETEDLNARAQDFINQLTTVTG